MTGTIYNGDYQTLLHTKYRSSGPFGFREEDFFSFSHCKSMETIYPRGVVKFDPRGMAGTIYVEDHYHIQNIKAVCPVVSEKKIFDFFFHSKSIETINLRGLAKFDPRGMNGTIYVEDH